LKLSKSPFQAIRSGNICLRDFGFATNKNIAPVVLMQICFILRLMWWALFETVTKGLGATRDLQQDEFREQKSPFPKA
jgi:hypothetical protein